MALRVKRTWRVVGWIVGATLLAAVCLSLVSGLLGSRGAGSDGGTVGSVAPQAVAPEELRAGAPGADAAGVTDSDQGSLKYGSAVSSDAKTGGGTAQSMIIRAATLELQVDKVDDSLKRIRASAAKNGADIEQLIVSGGRQEPRPLTNPDVGYPTPANATVVLRVPADKLGALSADVAKLGNVISQSSSSDDVTQQYVDLDARLKNLKSEESRLRTFFSRATKVDDLLAVERELARVRGEIEAMQAQVDYLERQVARATLTVSLTELGPVLQPSGVDWGFVEAIRRGIQGAAALVTALITVVIAIAPLVAIISLVWLLSHWVLKRRRQRRGDAHQEVDAEEIV